MLRCLIMRTPGVCAVELRRSYEPEISIFYSTMPLSDNVAHLKLILHRGKLLDHQHSINGLNLMKLYFTCR